MSIRPYRDIARRKSRKICVGNVEVGGDARITVESPTFTSTTNVPSRRRTVPPVIGRKRPRSLAHSGRQRLSRIHDQHEASGMIPAATYNGLAEI
jgi:hypothetical protein